LSNLPLLFPSSNAGGGSGASTDGINVIKRRGRSRLLKRHRLEGLQLLEEAVCRRVGRVSYTTRRDEGDVCGLLSAVRLLGVPRGAGLHALQLLLPPRQPPQQGLPGRGRRAGGRRRRRRRGGEEGRPVPLGVERPHEPAGLERRQDQVSVRVPRAPAEEIRRERHAGVS